MNTLEGLVDVLRRQGFDPLKQQYVDSWLHTDQEVRLPSSQSALVPLCLPG